MLWVLLFFAGIFIAGFSTLVGITGGFIIVPLLLYLYPEDSAAIITSISLAVSFFTALTGSIAYARLRRIDYRSGLLFALAGVPGAILGAGITTFISRDTYQGLFGFFLVAVAVYLLARPLPAYSHHNPPISPSLTAAGYRHAVGYTYNLPLALSLSFAEGFLSGLLGISGGVIFVPVLIQLLNFPAHIATATSQFMLTFVTFSGVGVRALTGAFTAGYRRTIVLTLGAFIGASLGARLSQRVPARFILRLLAVAMALIGMRLVLGFFVPG